METIFSYSLRKHIDATMKPDITRAVIMEDGLSASKLIKPYVTIEYTQEVDEILSAGRRSYEEIHAYQIGVFGKSGQNLGDLRSKLKEILRNPGGVPIYDIATGQPTGGTFVIDVGEYTPMRADDTAEETFEHRGYFVVEIEILRNAGEFTFTQ